MSRSYAIAYSLIAIAAGVVPVLVGRWIRVRDERRQQFLKEHQMLLEAVHRLEDHIAWDDMNDRQRDEAIRRRARRKREEEA